MYTEKPLLQPAADPRQAARQPRPRNVAETPSAQPEAARTWPQTLTGALALLTNAERRAPRPGQAERRLLLSRVTEAMHEGVALFTPGGEIAYVNKSACRMLHMRRASLVGKQARAFFGDVVDRAMRAKAKADGQPHAVTTYEARLETSAGDPLLVLVSAHRLDLAESASACLAVLTDLTGRERAESELRQARSDLRLLSSQLVAAEQLERKRIARELHDGIGQSLGAIKYGLENCSRLLAAGDSAAAAHGLRGLIDGMKRSVDELRRVSMNLRPTMLDDIGAIATVSWFTREFRALHRSLRLETLVEAREADIPPQAKTALFRILQEALNNIVSHSRATCAWVSLQRAADSVILRVRDNGAGFDPASFATVDDAGRGLGLASMRERAEASGGRFVVDSKPALGTHILVHWPCARVGALAGGEAQTHNVQEHAHVRRIA
jgi:PAS domain S-box-containing protein